MAHQIDVTSQNVIIARLRDFCQFNKSVSQYESDMWGYMKQKLLELETPVEKLKQDQLMAAADDFIAKMKSGALTNNDIVEMKTSIDQYLSANDFVDIAFNLTQDQLANANGREVLTKLLKGMKAISLFQEERKPEAQRGAKQKKLVAELYTRLHFDVLDKTLSRKPKTPRRRRMVLRRIRRNVSEYCSVLHLPFNSNDTFSPFMLLRVEALLVASLRLLIKHR